VTPTWSRVKRAEISEETLKYYDLDYYTDPDDSSWFIIRTELSQREIDVLFETTRREKAKDGARVRSRRQEGLEAREDGGLVSVRDRSRSKSRERSRNIASALSWNISSKRMWVTGNGQKAMQSITLVAWSLKGTPTSTIRIF